jgi:predicted RNA binding protein YcfA (HicA-like mRNA interferase family)
MSKSPLKNIPLKTFRDYLKYMGLEHVRTKGSHEIWKGNGLSRSIVLPTSKNPVKEGIVRSILMELKVNADSYVEFLKS